MRQLFCIMSVFTICCLAFCPGDAKPNGRNSAGADLLGPVACRLQEASVEYSSESWGCTDRILLSGNGKGERTYANCRGPQPVPRRILYSSDEFLSLLSEFLLGQYFSMASEYCHVISNVGLSQDSMIVWGIDVVVDAEVVKLTLRMKDYSKTVSFFPECPQFKAPAVLDSLARQVVDFADKHAEAGSTRK